MHVCVSVSTGMASGWHCVYVCVCCRHKSHREHRIQLLISEQMASVTHTHTHSRVNTKHSHGNWWCNRHTHTLWCNRCNVGLRHMLALLQLRWWESRACHRQETCPGSLKMSKSHPSFYTIRKKQKPAMKSYSNRSITPPKAQHKTTIWDHGKYKIGMSFILIFSEASGLFAGLFNSIINWTKK